MPRLPPQYLGQGIRDAVKKIALDSHGLLEPGCDFHEAGQLVLEAVHASRHLVDRCVLLRRRGQPIEEEFHDPGASDHSDHGEECRGALIGTLYNVEQVNPTGARFRLTSHDDAAFVGVVSELVSSVST